MESAEALLTGRDARERTEAPTRRMIGLSVHLVRLLGTRVLRSVANAAAPVGCLSATEGYERCSARPMTHLDSSYTPALISSITRSRSQVTAESERV